MNLNEEWRICPKCKESRRHDLVYIHTVGGRVVERQFMCTMCGHKHMVVYKKKVKK